MFYFLADDDNVILKLCASLKIMETFFFALFVPLKFAKALRTTKQQQKKKFYRFIKTCSGRNYWVEKKKDISWNRTYRSPVMNNVRWFVPLKADVNTVYIISAEQIMSHLQFLEIYSGIHDGPYLKHFTTIWAHFLTPAAFPKFFGFISVCRSLHSQFPQTKIKA